MRARAIGRIAAIIAAAVALAGCAVMPTSAAYTDQAHVRSEEMTARIPLPLRMGLSGIRSLETAGGLGSDGNPYVWGRTDGGIAGTTAGGTRREATRVTGLPEGEIVAVSGQPYGFNGLQSDGQVWAWGQSPGFDGTVTARPGGRPEKLRIGSAWNGQGELLTGVTAIATAETAGAAIRGDGTVFSWGQRASGGPQALTSPQPVPGLPDPNANDGEHFPIAITAGYHNFWVILQSGEVWYWGSASSSPGGDPDSFGTARRSTALAPWFRNSVTEGSPYIVQIGGGINMGQAVLSNGRVLTWGSVIARAGERPVPPAAQSPGLVEESKLSGIVDSASGFTGAVFLDRDGQLFGFGAGDDYGGNPTRPTLLDTDVEDFTAGQGYYIWRKSNGEFWGKGYNPQGATGAPYDARLRKISLDLSPLT